MNGAEKIEEAVGRVLAGETGAFREIVEHCTPAMKTVVTLVVADKGATDDILQEAFLAIYRELANYRRGSNFVAWASTMARYAALTHRKRRQRESDALTKGREGIMDRLAEHAMSGGLLDELEVKSAALLECVKRLPEHARDMIDMRYFKGLQIGQIAEQRNGTASAIAVALHRIRLMLVECVRQAAG